MLDKKKLRSDPSYFIKHIIGMELTSYQAEWLKLVETKKRISLMAFRSCLSGNTVVHNRDGSVCQIKDHPDAWCMGKNKTYRIKLNNKNYLDATAEHPIFTTKGWKQVKDLNVGDIVATLVQKKKRGSKCKINPLLLGLLSSDSYCFKALEKGQSIKFINTNLDLLKRFEELIIKEYPELICRKYKKGNGYDYVVTSGKKTFKPNRLRTELRSLKIDDYFPLDILTSTNKDIIKFLEGLYASDGCFYVREGKYASISLHCGLKKIFARYVCALLKRLGIHSYVKKSKGQFNVMIERAKQQTKFCKLVKPIGKDVNKVLKANENNKFFNCDYDITDQYKFKKYKFQCFEKGSDNEIFKWCQIQKITYKGIEDVYDLHVPVKQWFVANNILVHNSGKTRQLLVNYFIWKAVTNPMIHTDGYCIISKTLPQAIGVLRNIRETILTNKMLKTLVPPNRSKSWSRTEIELNNGGRILSKPYTNSIRGFHFGGIACDEIGEYEDSEILTKAILPTIRAHRGFFIGVGTPKSSIDVLHEIESDPGFSSIYTDRFPATGDKGNLFEERYPDSKIEYVDGAVHIVDRKTGQVIETYSSLTWEQEFMLNPVGLQDQLFPESMISVCLDTSQSFTEELTNHTQTFMGVDFAMSAQSGADYTVVTILEKRLDTNKLRLLNIYRWKGLDYNIQKERIVELSNKFKVTKILGDESSFGKTFIYDLKAEGIPIDGFKFTPGSKEDLIKALRDQFEKKGFIIPYSPDDFKTRTTVKTLMDELTKFGIIFDARKKLVRFEGLGKYDDCLREGTRIFTENGWKPVEDVKIGDSVLTHRGRFRKVWRTVKKPFKGKYLRIKPYGSLEFDVTHEHPIYACKKSNFFYKYKDKSKAKRFWNPKWVLPHQLANGYRTMYPIMRQTIKCPYSKEKMWLIGFYLANGSCKNDGMFCLSFNSKNKKDIKKAKECMKKEYGLEFKQYTYNNCVILQKGMKKHIQFYLNLGKSEDRKLPSSFLKYPVEYQKALYDGYFCGDGYVDPNGNHITASISKELSLQMQMILLRMNKPALISKLKRKRYGTKNKDQYWVSWKESKHNNVKVTIEGDYLISAIHRINEGYMR